MGCSITSPQKNSKLFKGSGLQPSLRAKNLRKDSGQEPKYDQVLQGIEGQPKPNLRDRILRRDSG